MSEPALKLTLPPPPDLEWKTTFKAGSIRITCPRVKITSDEMDDVEEWFRLVMHTMRRIVTWPADDYCI